MKLSTSSGNNFVFSLNFIVFIKLKKLAYKPFLRSILSQLLTISSDVITIRIHLILLSKRDSFWKGEILIYNVVDSDEGYLNFKDFGT